MGCFFGCFRVKDSDRTQPQLVSAAGSSKIRDPLVSDNRLASLLRLEAHSSPPKDAEKRHSESIYGDVDRENFYSELKKEAKFLKSCGTLSETPGEIRKASEKMRILSRDQNHESSNFHSWLPGSSGKRLLWEEEADNLPISPVKPEDEGKTFTHGSLESPDHKYVSHTHVQQKQAGINNASSDSTGLQTAGTALGIPVHLQEEDGLPSVTPELPLLNTESKKCVRFECDPSESDAGRRDGNGRLVGQQQSPYPTPLRLTDEMQTPATVFPAKLENVATGKNVRMRSQYVYPVLNPIENSSQWNALKGSDAHQRGFSEDTADLHKNYSPEFLAKTPMSCRATADVLQQNEHGSQKVEASLTDWLKPVSASDKRSHSSFSSEKTSTGRSSDIERPILGMVAAHWNDDEPSQISPKWWDGKGIPNSTNKYKEDQKVSWHATPFEERLEKALSDERLFPQQSHVGGGPISFEEHEESDTAASYFQAPTHLTHLHSAVQS